jgi:ankyrin repeat protein
MLKELLRAGADINGTNVVLATPLMMALSREKLPLARLLLGERWGGTFCR